MSKTLEGALYGWEANSSAKLDGSQHVEARIGNKGRADSCSWIVEFPKCNEDAGFSNSSRAKEEESLTLRELSAELEYNFGSM
jgi:hypothetical protein